MSRGRLFTVCGALALLLVLSTAGEAVAQNAPGAGPGFRTSVTFPRTFTGHFTGCNYPPNYCAKLTKFRGTIAHCGMSKDPTPVAMCDYDLAFVEGTLTGEGAGGVPCSIPAELPSTEIILTLFATHVAMLEVNTFDTSTPCTAGWAWSNDGNHPPQEPTLTWEQGSPNVWHLPNGDPATATINLHGSHVCRKCT